MSEKPSTGYKEIEQHAQVHHEEAGEAWLISYADMMTLLVGFFVILLSFSKVDDEKFEQVKQIAAKQFGGVYEVPYGQLADRIKASMSKIEGGGQFVVKQTSYGVEISFLGTSFFDSGTATVKPGSRELLEKMIPVIKSEAKNFNVLIEGHTDDVPLAGGTVFKNNWDLSSVRACRVLDFFESAGFSKIKLTAVGFADSRPLVPNRDASGTAIPGNQSQNRRVVIKVSKPNESLILPPSEDSTDAEPENEATAEKAASEDKAAPPQND